MSSHDSDPTDRGLDRLLARLGLLEDAARRLRPGGALWLVGRTKLGVKTLARDITPLFDRVETIAIKGGYRAIVGRAAVVVP